MTLRAREWAGRLLAVTLLFQAACGYHTAGHTVQLPESVKTIAVPSFKNETPTYRIEQMDAATRIYGVAGDPVAHSLSPVIMNAALRRENVRMINSPRNPACARAHICAGFAGCAEAIACSSW